MAEVAPGDDLLRIGRLLEGGWQALKGNVGDWVLTYVVAIVLGVVVIAMFALYNWAITEEKGDGAFSYTVRHPIRPVEILLVALEIIAFFFVLYGIDRTALAVSKGERALVNDVWNPKRFGPYVLAMVLAIGLTVAGWFVFVVGAVVMGALVLYVPFFVLDGAGDGISSVFRSIGVTSRRGVFWSQILFWVITSAVMLLGLVLTVWALYALAAASLFSWTAALRNLTLLALVLFGAVVTLVTYSVSRIAIALGYRDLAIGTLKPTSPA